MKIGRKLLILSSMLLSVISVVADSTTCGVVKYYYSKDDDSGNVTITSVDRETSGHVVIPSSLDGGVVTAIGSEAFYTCKYITGLTIPETVTSIGPAMCKFCYALTSCNIPSQVTSIPDECFYQCGKLQPIEFPKGLKTIGNNAFYGCNSFSKVDLPSSLSSIGIRAFYGIDDLKFVELPSGIDSIGDQAFSGTGVTRVVLPSDLSREIGAVELFSLCEDLTEVVLPDDLKYIPEEAFAFCSSLTNISIPIKVEEIGSGAFEWTALESVILPDGVKIIGAEAFENCDALEWVHWPSELTKIGELAFFSCEAITNSDFRNTKLTIVGDRAFDSCLAMTNGIYFPRTLQELGAQALDGIGDNHCAWYMEHMPYDKMNSFPGLTVEFLGPPPVAGDDLLATESETNIRTYGWGHIGSYQYLKFPDEFKDEWIQAIEEYKASHIEETWEWHNLRITELVAEPVNWENDKPAKNEQTLTIGWHLPTNENYTIEEALAELPTRHLRYAVWRSGEDPEKYDDFGSAVCVTQNVTSTNYVDESFGKIGGTHPVCYWVEIQRGELTGDSTNRMSHAIRGEVFKCVTRRRFGFAVGVSDYYSYWSSLVGYLFDPGGLPEPRADALAFERLLRESDGVLKDEDVFSLLDKNATWRAVHDAWRNPVFEHLVPGDIMFFFGASHGQTLGRYSAGSILLSQERYLAEELVSDIQYFCERHPCVRVVNIIMACHSGGMVQNLGKNVAWIHSCKSQEKSSSIGKELSMFSTAFLEYGWNQLAANNTNVRGYWNESKYMAPTSGDITLYDLAAYSRRLAFGLASMFPAHVDVGDWGDVLKSINMIKRTSAALKSPPAIMPRPDVAVVDNDVLVVWQGDDDAEFYVVRYEDAISGVVDFVTVNRDLRSTLQMRTIKYEGGNYDENNDHYNPLKKEHGYRISVAAVNQAGLGLFSDATDSPREEEYSGSWQISDVLGNSYVGSVSCPFELSGTSVRTTLSESDTLDSMTMAFAVTREAIETNFSCRVSFDASGAITCSNAEHYVKAVCTPSYVVGTVDGLSFAVRNVELGIPEHFGKVVETAAIIRDPISEDSSQSSFDIHINIETTSENVLALSVDLVEPNGGVVGTISTNKSCVCGTNSFVLSMSSAWLKSKKKNGPFRLANVKLCHETNVVDSVDDLYVTQMSDFATYYGFTADRAWSTLIDGVLWNYQLDNHKASLIWEMEVYGYKYHMCAIYPVPTGCFVLPDALVNCPVVCIGENAFEQCDELCELIIPAAVTNICADAFSGCTALTNIVFEGDAPIVADGVFAELEGGCVVTVCENSNGWDEDGDGLWNGLTILYKKNADPIPKLEADASPEKVAEALSGSTDAKLFVNITNAANYNAYRLWAESVKKPDGSTVAGAQAVKDSPNAWLSFAIGSQTLLDTLPTNGQMKIDQFEPTSTAGLFDFSVSIDDIPVGSDAVEENLKKVFGLEGGSNLKDLSTTNVNIIFGTPSDGKVKFTAGPKDTKQSPFFMKVKMTP